MNDLKIYKTSGAGNDFIVLDGRKADMGAFLQPERISELCRKYHTDGLMILAAFSRKNGNGSLAVNLNGEDMTIPDFRMEFYNPDGSGGMMCGNGVSEINNIEQIDRGYEDIDGRLNALGAKITRK